MRFALTTEQQELHQVVAQLLGDACTPDVVRAGTGSPQADRLYAGLVDLGATGLLVDEEAGGLGLDENYLVPVLVEIGRAAAPLPLVDTLAVAPGLLSATGRAEDVLAGTVCVAADPVGNGLVRFGSRADLLLQGGWGGSGVIRVVDLAGAQREPQAAVDPAADLQRISFGTIIAEIDDPALVRTAWLRGVLGSAAELVGLSRRMLDLTVGYVKERQQFGVPIGSFQAVKHHLASALLAVEFAAPTVSAAGYALATGDEQASVAVATAKALASDAAVQVARATLQCHGAIAYTTEYDWQLFAKRAWAVAAQWGTAAWHRDAVARALGLPASGTSPAH
ncbi:acyl-CoA dehydrogenase [Nakamurella lactea]|uniref:acyl-CoA dehydrogenase n=1 Tax=Nakamurella lactea TaxID=459515 RepID=UPI000413A754|nr:acyl-CoA dehydrogenase [Nakamurella lactea]